METKPTNINRPVPGTQEHQQYIDNAVIQYDKTYSRSRIINADMARRILPGYDPSDIANEQRYFGDSAEITDKIYKKWLNERGGSGKAILFMAGGTGSGKSIASQRMSRKEWLFIVDSTFASKDYSYGQIDQALNAGYKVHVMYLYRDPIDAWENGVWRRWEENMGHFVLPEIHLYTHIFSRNNILEMAEIYDNNVTLRLLENNSKNDCREINLDELKQKIYNENVIGRIMNEISRKKAAPYPELKDSSEIYL